MKNRYEDGSIPKEVSGARKSVAKQLKDVRLSLNMTQEHLAELSGTKKSNISRLESGSYNPSLDFLVKIASSMGKHLDIHLD